MNNYEILDLQQAKYFYVEAASAEEACAKLNLELYKCFVKEVTADGKIHYYDPQMKELIEPICRPFLNFLLWLTKKLNKIRRKK